MGKSLHIEQSTVKQKRCGAIEFLRFVFSFMIVAWHCKKMGNPAVGTTIFSEAGYIGVEFFFLVSGFLMAKTVFSKQVETDNLGKETLGFVWGKIKVILPYYLLAFAFSCIRTFIAKDYSLRETLEYLLWGIWDFAFLQITGITPKAVISASWYLSAMFFSMLLLYPLLRKYKQTFTHIIAPLLSFFLLGYLKKTYAHLDLYSNNFTYIYSGMIRAIAELSLGCICFEIYEKIKTVEFTDFGRILITAIQTMGYGGVLICASNLPSEDFVYVMLLTLVICVPLTFSQKGICSSWYNNKLVFFLGRISMVIYLNHRWVRDVVNAICPDTYGYWSLISIIFVSTFVISAIFMKLMSYCSAFWMNYKTRISSLFILQ